MTDALLFTPHTLGEIPLTNRVVMAPMTRNRASAEGLPLPIMETYYRQRASAGLIISEMTQIAPDALGYMKTPGIHSDEQVREWRKITDAVHAEGGHIVMQIAHTGRISHPDLIGGKTPVAPSALQPLGKTWTPTGQKPYVMPRALEVPEIQEIVAQFAHAAAQAKTAGFDGIEIHAANGYLLDQFLRSGSNVREDAYGGTVAKRTRLLTEVITATVAVWGPGRVGVRLSPLNPFNSMHDAAPATTFPEIARILSRYPLAYLHLSYGGGSDEERAELAPHMRKAFDGPLIVNAGYDQDSAEEVLQRDDAEAVAFGVAFIANPDLPRRLAEGEALNTPNAKTFYGGGEQGYIDYPAMGEMVAAT